MKKIILTVACLMIAGAAEAQQYTGPRAITPGYTTGSFQASNQAGRYLEPANPLQQRAAAALAAEAGVACDVTSAGVVEPRHKSGGAAKTYEVACKNDFGWIVSKAGNKISAYDCVALDTSAKAA